MRTHIQQLLDSTAGRVMAPPNDGPGFDDDGIIDDLDDSGAGDGGDEGVDDDEEITDDPLDELWDDEEDDGDENQETRQEYEARIAGEESAAETALIAEMTGEISRYAVPEDMIPDDFNPSDPKQLRELLAQTGQRAIRTSLGLIMKPVAAAMGRMQEAQRAELNQRLANDRGRDTTESILLRNIPIAKSAKMRPIVDVIWNQALKRAKGNTADAVKATKKSLVAAGIGIGTPAKSSGNRQGAVTGKAALDLYAPIQKPVNNAANVQRSLRNNLRSSNPRQGQ